ncbi:LuxR C-terminal-related transcriptional regulator [Streptomyces sp. NPDC059874]|uniref:helix-turn-helix transcriptional regulator n=1 Tax=Streptomyces sp. NPDC059874 TaxID=3346983 RepID=UPI003662E65F
MCTRPENREAGNHTEICEEGRRVYRVALLNGSVDKAEAPACLSELGLLTSSAGDPGTLVPVPPSVATSAQAYPVEQAILAQQQRLAALRASMSEVESIYQEARQHGDPAVERLVGPAVIAAALDEATQATTEELLTAQPGGSRPEGILAESLRRVVQAQERGVVQRTLYQHTVRAHGPTLDYIRTVTEAGVAVRTLDEVFDRLIVFDRSVAFIPDKGAGDRSNHALVIRDVAIVHFLASVFEHAWERAEPVAFKPAQQRPRLLTDKTRLRVLQLMVDGYTDAAIASRLGMSTRTVATHLKKASDMLGSNSRAQLAYFTARTGLLGDSSSDGCLCDTQGGGACGGAGGGHAPADLDA